MELIEGPMGLDVSCSGTSMREVVATKFRSILLANLPPVAPCGSPSPEVLLLPFDAELVARFGDGLSIGSPPVQTAPIGLCSGIPQRQGASRKSGGNACKVKFTSGGKCIACGVTLRLHYDSTLMSDRARLRMTGVPAISPYNSRLGQVDCVGGLRNSNARCA